MKRHAALTPLSREHHAALVLAKRARGLDVGDSAAVAAFQAQLAQAWAADLDPHFQREEQHLLPCLTLVRESALVTRTYHEHRQLREQVAAILAGDSAAILPFGEALDAHVRFEERELFPVAEELLPQSLLARVAAGLGGL